MSSVVCKNDTKNNNTTMIEVGYSRIIWKIDSKSNFKQHVQYQNTEGLINKEGKMKEFLQLSYCYSFHRN